MEKLIEDISDKILPYIAPEDIDLPHIRSKNHYEWYYTYGKKFKPRSILEIGTRRAYSAMAVAMGSEQIKSIMMIDNEASGASLSEAHTNFHRAFPDTLITTFKIDTTILAKKMNQFASIDKFDYIHVDGDHSFQGIINEMSIATECISENAVIVVDDVGSDILEENKGTQNQIREGLKKFIKNDNGFEDVFNQIYINSFTGHYVFKYDNRF